ncbi:MAG: DUF3999 family protein [Acidobacteriaceae bacterium]|nr:DUF3999 family protein [Acidobacteriaceae bacterium]
MEKVVKLAVLLLLACPAMWADFAPQAWQYRTPIEIKNNASVSSFVINRDVYAHSRAHLDDLRIVRAGSEIPYHLVVLSGRHEDVDFQPVLLDDAVVPGAGLQVVLDADQHRQHNRLLIETSQQNFVRSVNIETSDDRRHWATVLKDGIIFDVSRLHQSEQSLALDYPLSTRRYVRITIPNVADPAFIRSAWLTYHAETPPSRETLASLTPKVTLDEESKTTSLICDTGSAYIPYNRLELTVDPGLFMRTAEVFVSTNGTDWTWAGAGVISRTQARAQLSIDLSEQWSRWLKIDIANADNAPLRVRAVQLSAFRRIVRFPSQMPGAYWLYSGNSQARPPSYDFAQIAENQPATDAISGAAQSNSEYQPPRQRLPWTDRNPMLLNGALIAVAVVMAAIIFKMFTRVKAM